MKSMAREVQVFSEGHAAKEWQSELHAQSESGGELNNVTLWGGILAKSQPNISDPGSAPECSCLTFDVELPRFPHWKTEGLD